MGIEDILMHDESLFQNINAFDPDYVPPNYNYRDRQMEAMAMAIRPAISGGQPSNSVVLGSCATGKTTDKKALIVALDDVNYLFQSKAANKVFYDLLRAYEEYPGVKTGIFAILSDLEFRYAFDKNVNTVFIPQDITFQPYTYSEIEDILRDRVNAGFFPGVMGDEILELVAMHTYDVGDLRVGINLLRSCGNIAEADASREITEEHFQKAVDSLVSVQISETLKSLNDTEKALLKIISDSDKIFTAGELSELFKEKENVSYATFNRTLEKLEFLRLVDTKFTGKGSRGNSREIILRFNPCDFKL